MAALHRPALPAPRAFGKQWPAKLLLVAAISLLVAIAVLKVNQFSRATSTSYEINALTRQRADQLAQNHELEAEVARLSSLARVDIEARTRLHMEPAGQKLYIGINQPVPERQSLPTRFLPRQHPQAAPSGGAFWKRLLHRVPFF